jgi:hypothetical protein
MEMNNLNNNNLDSLKRSIESIVSAGGIKAYQTQVIAEAIISLLIEEGLLSPPKENS